MATEQNIFNQEAPQGQNPPAEQQKKEQSAAGITPKDMSVAQKSITDDVLTRIHYLQEMGEVKLPKNYSAANALKFAYLILNETTDKNGRKVLDACTRASIANALLDMVCQGLSPAKNQCYFIAHGTELQMRRSYMGTMMVAMRVGGVIDILANPVYEGDDFTYSIDNETGIKKIIKHEQKLENLSKTVKGAYAILTLEDGTRRIEIMDISQIRKAWAQSPTKGNSPAHINFPDEMAKRTVINRACKLRINSSDDADLSFDEGDEDKDGQQRGAVISGRANRIPLAEISDTEIIDENQSKNPPAALPSDIRPENTPSSTETKPQEQKDPY
jgi:recombination protein RecT